MNAVWLVRSRQLVRKFRFWLTIVGYNPRDPSLGHKVYLVYAAIFFTAWGFAVLTLLASGAAVLLLSTGLPPVQGAVALTLLALLGWNLLSAFYASQASPLVFSEDDAYILCQSPVNRRAVAFAWLAGELPEQSVLMWGIAVTLGFALVEVAYPGQLGVEDLPYYIGNGLRALLPVLLLQLALLELTWSLGISRLRRDRDLPSLVFVPLALAGLLGLLVFTGTGPLLGRLVSGPAAWLLKPLSWVLYGAMGESPWSTGLGLGLVWVVLGTAALLAVSPALNLSRAAQESGYRAYRVALFPARGIRSVGASGAPMPQQAGHTPNRSPARPGAASLLWKDSLQTRRSGWLSLLWPWLVAFGLGLGITLAADNGLRLWALIFWVLYLHSQAAQRLSSDLRLWMFFRQLPFSARRLVLGEVAGAWMRFTLAAWVAALVGWFVRPSALQMLVAVLAPFSVGILLLAGVFDILRRSKSADLMAGAVPQPGILGLLLGAGLVLVSLLLFGTAWSPVLLALAVIANLLFLQMLWVLSARMWRQIA